jgi:hypothetical protein
MLRKQAENPWNVFVWLKVRKVECNEHFRFIKYGNFLVTRGCVIL